MKSSRISADEKRRLLIQFENSDENGRYNMYGEFVHSEAEFRTYAYPFQLIENHSENEPGFEEFQDFVERNERKQREKNFMNLAKKVFR